MTIEERLDRVERSCERLTLLCANLHRLSRGLGLETVFDHPAALSIGTRQQIGVRGEAGDGGVAAPYDATIGVYGTSENDTGVQENCGVVGNATRGRLNSAVKGRYQRVNAESAGLVAEEVDGSPEAAVLTRVRISPFGFVAEGVKNPLPSFVLTAGGYGFWWEGGHAYWMRPDGSRALLIGT